MTDQIEVPEEIKIFLVEAYENLDQIEQDFVSLEQGDGGDQELLNGIFRSVHTIKGNSGFLALSNLEQLCHRAETVLDRLRNGEIQVSQDLATTMLSFVDLTRTMLGDIEATGSEGDADITGMLGELDNFLP